MARHEFGRALDDPDVLVLQGVEYPMQPIGMRIMRRILSQRQMASKNLTDPDPEKAAAASMEMMALMEELVISAVLPECREDLRVQLEESISPGLLGEVATHLLGNLSDLNPTQPGSSSNGSPATGRSSTDGALPAELTPAPSQSAG